MLHCAAQSEKSPLTHTIKNQPRKEDLRLQAVRRENRILPFLTQEAVAPEVVAYRARDTKPSSS